MKSQNAGRLPWTKLLRSTLDSSAPSSAAESVKSLIAKSLQSPSLHTLQPRHDIEHVIARALVSAGLTAEAPGGKPAPRLRTTRLHKIPHRQIFPSAGSSANDPVESGQFLDGSFTNSAGTRAYKLFVPNRPDCSEAASLVVMLHGCTQSPSDFALGTQMNQLAARDGFFVLYPAQSANANGSNCWNWFRAEDQQRECGEPHLIAALTRQIVSSHGIDPKRVFVAGLSAGAAMAVILGATYPDVFSAVGAHSGLPLGAAHDMASAFAAMKSSGVLVQGVSHARARRSTSAQPMPTIVFHGDRDFTVDVENGATIVCQAVEAYGGEGVLRAPQHTRLVVGNCQCERVVHADASNRPVVEHWTLHGAGHAWSGGNASGSYTDVSGPSASEEMIRFFHIHGVE